MLKQLTALFLAVALLPLAGALELQLGSDSVEMSACTHAAVGVWATGTGQTVRFSAEPGLLQATFDSPYLAGGGVAGSGTIMRISSPACLEGSYNIPITVQSCNATKCEQASKTLHAVVRRCTEYSCNGYVINTAPKPTASPSSCGSVSCASVYGKIDYRDYFEPSQYALKVSTPVAPRAQAGGSTEVEYRVDNTGASGSFTAKAYSNEDGVTILPGRTLFDLRHDEETKLGFTIMVGKGVTPGVKTYKIIFLKGSLQVASVIGRIVVTETAAAALPKLTLPQTTGDGISVSECDVPQGLRINAELENPLEAADFTVTASVNGRMVFSRELRVPQGVVAEFDVQLPAGALRKGANKITVAAITDGFSGSGEMVVFVGECSNANAVAHVNEEGAGITVIATVANAGSSPLANVTLDFEGLPEGWNYSSGVAFVTAGGEANVTARILPNSAAAVEPVIIVKSNGVEVARVKLQVVNKPQSITGLLTSAGANPLLIIAAGIAFFIVVVFYYNARTGEEERERKTAEYREKLRKLREQIVAQDAPAPAAPVG